jgi:NTE family protein
VTDEIPPARPASYDKKVGLVLQGGGALGSYQAGVYEALASSQYLPDWVAGISIGAINAAIIAGNAPEHRVQRLRSFWEEITAPTKLWPSAPDGPLAAWQHGASALAALMFGQPGFFTPRPPHDWFSFDPFVSYYKTSALKGTLERLVDFDRINDARDMRLSVGAVNVLTGHFAYFDSEKITIRPEHVMASGALPPGFPPIEIDGEQYWDGGLFSNTPLQYLVDYSPRRSRLIFQIDVFPAHGRLPTNLDEVNERDKDIRYSSRTRLTTDTLREKHDVRHAINELHKLLPPDLAKTEQAERLYEYGCVTEMDRAAHLPPDGAPGRVEGLRVQPLDHGGAVAAGAVRRPHHLARLAVARADAAGARRARVRCDTRHPRRTSQARARSTSRMMRWK